MESSEDEVKSLLFQILLRMSTEQNDDDLVKDLKSTYSNFLRYNKEKNRKMQNILSLLTLGITV